MSDNGRGCVVVGAGLAAATVAQTLRDGGFKHPVTLIGEESERPYERPALSKDYLQGKTPVAELYVHSSDWYGDHQVRGRFGEKVLSIDRGRSEVRLQSGEAVAYDQLVIATGATPGPSACQERIWPASTRSGGSRTPTRSVVRWHRASVG